MTRAIGFGLVSGSRDELDALLANARDHLGPAYRDARTFHRLDRAARLLAIAVERALAGKVPESDTGIVLGSAAGCALADARFEATRALPEGPSPALFPATLPTAPAAEVSIRLGLTGPVVAVSSRDSFALALALGAGWIERGDARRVLACGLEVGGPEETAGVVVLERDGPGARLNVSWPDGPHVTFDAGS